MPDDPNNPKSGATKPWHIPFNGGRIPIDANGTYQGIYFEGTLGTVLILSKPHVRQDIALKLPRLIADTITENFHIHDLLWQEDVFVGEVKGGGTLAERQTGEPLAKQMAGLSGEDAAFNSGVVFINFHKQQAPRFGVLGVLQDKKVPRSDFGKTDHLWFFPNNREVESLAKVVEDSQQWDEMAKAQFTKPWYFVCGADNHAHQYGALKEAITHQLSTVAWFTGLSAIPWQYYEDHMERVAHRGANGELGKWGLADHISLTLHLAEGVKAIHEQDAIHADIRPANVFCYSPNRAGPAGYRLGDYGSFSRAHMPVAQNDVPDDMTLSGVSTGKHRVSPFYAPERRHAMEYEDADCALIIREVPRQGRSSKVTLVALGMRNELEKIFDPNVSSKLEQTAREKIEALFADEPKPHAKFREGDLLQVRDYLLRIEGCMEADDLKYFLCGERLHLILNDRMSVPPSPAQLQLGKVTFMGLPRYHHVQRWSAATDIYSLGVVFLFTLFHKVPAAERVDAFELLQDTLDDMQNFIGLWDEVHSLVTDLILAQKREETRLKPGENFQQDNVANALTKIHGIANKSNPKPLSEAAMLLALQLRSGLPGAATLLTSVNNNAAEFLLIIYFAFAAMHRRETLTKHLEVNLDEGDKDLLARNPLPVTLGTFCADRCAAPCEQSADGDTRVDTPPVNQLIAFLTWFRDSVQKQHFGSFVIPASRLEDEPLDTRKSGYQERIANLALTRAIKSRAEFKEVSQQYSTQNYPELQAGFERLRRIYRRAWLLPIVAATALFIIAGLALWLLHTKDQVNTEAERADLAESSKQSVVDVLNAAEKSAKTASESLKSMIEAKDKAVAEKGSSDRAQSVVEAWLTGKSADGPLDENGIKLVQLRDPAFNVQGNRVMATLATLKKDLALRLFVAQALAHIARNMRPSASDNLNANIEVSRMELVSEALSLELKSMIAASIGDKIEPTSIKLLKPKAQPEASRGSEIITFTVTSVAPPIAPTTTRAKSK